MYGGYARQSPVIVMSANSRNVLFCRFREPRLQHGLDHLVVRFADPVERHQGLLLGLDVMYAKLNSADLGLGTH